MADTNRIINQTDVDNFSANYPLEHAWSLKDPSWQMKVGDVMIDSSNHNNNDRVLYNGFDIDFPDPREGFNLWLSHQETPFLHCKLYKEDPETTWAGKATANNPVKIKPIGGQFGVRRTVNNPGSYTFDFGLGVPYLDFDGYRRDYPGLTHGGGGRRRGTFGLRSDAHGLWEEGGNMFSFGGTTLKGLRMRGFEGYHGFACLRLFGNHPEVNTHLEYLTLEDFMLTEGVNGERIYMGATFAAPYMMVDNLIIRNAILSFAGAENLQVQHLARGSRESLVENIVSFAPARDWKNPFQNYQNNNLQFVYDEGKHIIRNSIIWGGGANYLYLGFGGQGTPQVNDRFIIENCLFMGTNNRGVYVQSNDNVGKIDFNNVIFGDSYEDWEELYGEPPADHHIRCENDIPMILRNCTYKNDKTFIVGNAGISKTQLINNTSTASVPTPQFKQQPLHSNRIERWHDVYAAFLAADGVIPIPEGRIVWNNSVDGFYYECISALDAVEGITPDEQPASFVKVNWDSAGYVSTDPLWDNLLTQYDTPTDEFILKADDPYNIAGMGLYDNEISSNRNEVRYEMCFNDGTDNPDTTFFRRIPRFSNKFRVLKTDILYEIGDGNFVRRVIYELGVRREGPWVQIAA